MGRWNQLELPKVYSTRSILASSERLESTIGIAAYLIKAKKRNNGFQISAQSDFTKLERNKSVAL
jgi:hypothetical protein